MARAYAIGKPVVDEDRKYKLLGHNPPRGKIGFSSAEEVRHWEGLRARLDEAEKQEEDGEAANHSR